MQAMLLAAGFGTRLRPYTLVRPKPLFPILNVPLLHILLDKLTLAGCTKVVVNCHHLAEQIEAAVADRSEVILQYEPKILGTGGSLRKALPLFDNGPVLVMNGDIYHDIDVLAIMKHPHDRDHLVTMAMHDYPRFNTVQVCGENVVSFGGNGAGTGSETLAFTGIHVLDRSVIARIPEEGFFHIIELYKHVAAEEQVGCMRVDGAFWRDIGTPDDYLELHRELLDGQKKDDDSQRWCISEDASVADNVELKEWGVIGAGAKVCGGASLSRCVVWEGTQVNSGQQLTDTIVCGEKNCSPG